MNSQHDLDQAIASVFAETAPVRAPDYLLPSAISRARRKRRWPRWYALIKEPTMHSDSRLAVGSPTARVLAVMVALLITLMVAGAGIAGSRLLAAGPIVVAQDGSGTTTTINEAVAMAEDGDTIVILPGTYTESIEITKDITLRGDGDRNDVVIEFTAESAMTQGSYSRVPYGIRLVDTTATVANLSVKGPDMAVGIQVSGGAPSLEALVIELAGEWRGATRDAFDFTDGAGGTMVDVRTVGFAFIRAGASPTIARLEHSLEGLVITGVGTDPVISRSTIGDLVITLSARPVITGNEIVGIEINLAGAAVIDNNTFTNPEYQAGDLIDDLSSNMTTGIDIFGSKPVVTRNTIADHPFGIRLDRLSAPTIQGNTIENNAVGLSLAKRDGGFTVAGNTFCDNGVDVEVGDGSTFSLEGNTVC